MLFNLLSEASNTPSGGGNYTMWILLGVLVVILGVMMFTSSRANKKRQKEAEEKLNGLRVGDRVKTIGGICGIVVEIDNDENTFVLETGMENSGNFIKFDKVAVYQSSHPEDVSVAEPAEPAEVSAEENADAAEAAEDVSETAESAETADNAEETQE
ncbi:MAG: preprotein translocase subunit YajC [Clostridia bacterium]|nr:preprotein translocase subunit YajC [Clostridia bacterium]